ncbi:YugN family protein [Salibacterium qingdaonense]|uniref:YugN-like family protein n=1 Tax=Salibacterium qingdaonense TaxID=266892 RepID=A0A1I4QCX0_9BACI|nr:YugN family protein [Salibacterium qingdaonense]SFM37877.1 YugN-like family protein [Salibacterium qingdaonense]
MIEISSKVEGHRFVLHDLEKKLKPLGYAIGGGWEYDHGCFDYKMSGEGEYRFFRVPFEAVDGELDKKGVKVAVGRPFVLSHEYKRGPDHIEEPYNAVVNQFQTPQNKDAEVSEPWVEQGERLNKELEDMLLS